MIRHFATIAATLYVPTLSLLLLADIPSSGGVLTAAELRQITGSNPQTQEYDLPDPITCTEFTIQYGTGVPPGTVPADECDPDSDSCLKCSSSYTWFEGLQQAMGNGGDTEVPVDCRKKVTGLCLPDDEGGYICKIDRIEEDGCIDLIFVQSQ